MTTINRIEELAKALQHRDAEQYGIRLPDEHGRPVLHPTWDECNDIAQDEYLTDAKYAASALDIIDRAIYEQGVELEAKTQARAEEYVDDCD